MRGVSPQEREVADHYTCRQPTAKSANKSVIPRRSCTRKLVTETCYAATLEELRTGLLRSIYSCDKRATRVFLEVLSSRGRRERSLAHNENVAPTAAGPTSSTADVFNFGLSLTGAFAR